MASNWERSTSMSTQTVEPKVMPSANLVQIGSRSKTSSSNGSPKSAPAWSSEAGLAKREVHHFKRPVEKPFTADQRGRHHAAVRRADLEARKAGAWRARRAGLPRRSRPHAQREGLPDRQRVRQQRPVQPDLFHRRKPGAVSAKPGRAGHSPSRKSSTGTCSSPPARAAPAASACTRPSTAWRCATPGSTVSACCCSSSPAA